MRDSTEEKGKGKELIDENPAHMIHSLLKYGYQQYSESYYGNCTLPAGFALVTE